MPELVGSAAVPSAHPLRGDGLPLAFTNERLSEAEPSRTASRSASDHSSWKAAATRIVSPAPGEGTGANDVQASSQQREEQDGAEDAIRSDADGHTLASDQSGKARADKSNGSTPHREDDDLKDGPGVKDPHLVSGGDLEKGGNCASDGEGDAPKDQRTELQDQTNFLPTRQVSGNMFALPTYR